MTFKPQFGDPELLPKGTVVRPSAERQIFDHSGVLKSEGAGPFPEGFLLAPDLKKFPQWVRPAGNQWTTQAFRVIVMNWLIGFITARPWVIRWDITEKASSDRMSVPHLPEDEWYLRIGMTRKSDSKRFEVAVAFRRDQRTDPAASGVLAHAAASLDQQQSSS